MAYLIDPSDAALAIGAQCAGKITSDNEQMLSILGLLLPRIEDAMNVASLVYGETTDIFSLDSPTPAFLQSNAKAGAGGSSMWRGVVLRLSNGYVHRDTDNPITITGPDNNVVTAFKADLRYGLITLPLPWHGGEYTVTYRAGLKIAPVDPQASPPPVPVFEDVPEWLRGLTVAFLILWYRTSLLTPKTPVGFRFGELIAPLRHEIYARVYERYQRPRSNLYFPVSSARADGMLT